MPGPPAPTTPPRAGMEDMISSWHPSNLRAEGGSGPVRKGAHARAGGGKQEEEESPEDRFFGTEPKRAHFHDTPAVCFTITARFGGNRRRDPPKKTTVRS